MLPMHLPVTRSIRADEVVPYRDLRLAALRESPTAFTATWEQESGMPMEEWAARVESSVSGKSVIVVAEVGDELVGLATGIPWGHRTRVVSVWVAPEVRRQGIAARLIEAVCAWARQTGYREAQIETASANPGPASLYQRLGFQPVDEEPPPDCGGVMVRPL